MSDETPYGPVQRFDLIHSLRRMTFYKLAVPAIREVGPASMTLAGIFKLTTKETFASAETIADTARVPVHTVRKHLVTLEEFGWIQNVGRQAMRFTRCPGGAEARIRRTNTIRLTAKAKRALEEDWSPLPWWAYIRPLPWSSRAVLAAVLRRLLKLIAAAERDCGTDDDDDIAIAIDDYFGGPDKFKFSLDRLVDESGVSRPSAVAAKSNLAHLGLVEWSPGDGPSDPDILWPNFGTQIVITPTDPGLCSVTFEPAKGG